MAIVKSVIICILLFALSACSRVANYHYHDNNGMHHHNCKNYQGAGPDNACPRKFTVKGQDLEISGVDNSCTYTVKIPPKAPQHCENSKKLPWSFRVNIPQSGDLVINFSKKGRCITQGKYKGVFCHLPTCAVTDIKQVLAKHKPVIFKCAGGTGSWSPNH